MVMVSSRRVLAFQKHEAVVMLGFYLCQHLLGKSNVLLDLVVGECSMFVESRNVLMCHRGCVFSFCQAYRFSERLITFCSFHGGDSDGADLSEDDLNEICCNLRRMRPHNRFELINLEDELPPLKFVVKIIFFLSEVQKFLSCRRSLANDFRKTFGEWELSLRDYKFVREEKSQGERHHVDRPHSPSPRPRGRRLGSHPSRGKEPGGVFNQGEDEQRHRSRECPTPRERTRSGKMTVGVSEKKAYQEFV